MKATRRGCAAMGAVAWAICAAMPASAQDGSGAPFPDGTGAVGGSVDLPIGTQAPVARRGSSGPLTQIDLTYDLRHDSNVLPFGQVGNNRVRSGSDQRVSPGVAVRMSRDFGALSLGLNASGGYDFYRRNDVLNAARLFLGANSVLSVSRCEIEFNPTISRRQSSLFSIVPVDTSDARAALRNIETIQDYRGTASCGGTYGFRPYVQASHSRGDNSNDLRQISDYRTTSYGGGVGYRSPGLGDLRLIYTHAKTDYPSRPLNFGLGDFTTDNVTFSAQRNIGAALQGGFSISYVDLSSDGPTANDFSGINGSVNLKYSPGPSTWISLDAMRDVGPALYADASYVKSSSIAGRVDHYLNADLSVHALASYRDRTYVGAGNAFGFVLTDDAFTSFSAGGTYRYGRRLRYSLNAGIDRRNGNGDLFDYTNHWVAFSTGFSL